MFYHIKPPFSSKMRFSSLVSILFLPGLLLVVATDQGVQHQLKTRTVSTLLNAKYHVKPTALEIAEFLNDEDHSYFWSFIEDLHKNFDHLSGSIMLAFINVVCIRY